MSMEAGTGAKGARRQVQSKGYSDAGASEARRALKSFIASSGAPNEDIDYNNMTLRQRARMLYMAAPIATSAINTNRTKIIGTGLILKSMIDREALGMTADAAKAWQRKAEAEFRLWASSKENCDATGISNFSSLQQLALKSWLMSGDVFALVKRYETNPRNPYTLRLHLVEADRVCTPRAYGSGIRFTDGINPDNKNKIYDGVEVDSNGMVVAYHICSSYPRGIFLDKDSEWTRVEARSEKTGLPNILHIMDSERTDQYRGVTYLAQVIEPILQLRRYTESELMAALVQSFFSAWIKTDSDTAGIPINVVSHGDIAGLPDEYAAESPDGSPRNPNDYLMGPATVLHLAEGEDVKFGNPNIPTAGFEGFVKTLCRLIGAALELPYEVLTKEFHSSYSASRAALMEAWEAFKMRRQWFTDDFAQPVYEMLLAEAVAIGRLKAPGFFDDPLIRAAWSGARWIGPVQGQLDPAKEVKAANMSVDRGFKTHEQAARELGGGDWEENVEELKAENEKLKEAGGGNYMAVLDDEEDDED